MIILSYFIYLVFHGSHNMLSGLIWPTWSLDWSGPHSSHQQSALILFAVIHAVPSLPHMAQLWLNGYMPLPTGGQQCQLEATFGPSPFAMWEKPVWRHGRSSLLIECLCTSMWLCWINRYGALLIAKINACSPEGDKCTFNINCITLLLYSHIFHNHSPCQQV